MGNTLFVTRSLAPNREDYALYLEQIFSTRHFTNHGSCSNKLEKQLSNYLNLQHLALCANGTLALQLAIHAAGLAGKEVITTPFSYVATVSALLWCGCTPIFADIDEETLCLDPASVGDKLTANTAGLMPVHVYGNICDVSALDELAHTAGLAVLYDAAQCFGSAFMGRSVLDYGDFAACSFHATKVFHTVEGGCVVAHSPEGMEALRLLRSCGHNGDTHRMVGTNAKLSELHAAVGLCLLDKVMENIASRKAVSLMYDALLPTQGIRRLKQREGLTYNYAYYPVIFEDEAILLRVMTRLNQENIFPRRYFYPALNTLPYLRDEWKQSCPVAERIAPCALCLPLYAELGEADVERVCATIRKML